MDSATGSGVVTGAGVGSITSGTGSGVGVGCSTETVDVAVGISVGCGAGSVIGCVEVAAVDGSTTGAVVDAGAIVWAGTGSIDGSGVGVGVGAGTFCCGTLMLDC